MDFKLPALPTALAEVIQIQRASTPDSNRLVEIIEKDPALALYVLRQVNSAYYGLRKQVSQINRAVTLLGAKRVCNMVLAAVLKQTFANIKGPMAQAVYQHILKTSLATAVLARDLADLLHLSSSETGFTAGLLHQMGRLALLYTASDRYLPLWYKRIPPKQHMTLVAPSLEAEQACFDTDYLKLGAMALQQWGLPEEFAAIMHRIRILEKVVESPIRILPLMVAIGRTVAEGIFEPPGYGSYAMYDNNGRPILLEKLAESRHLDVEAMDDFLNSRRDAVEQYAESLMHQG